MLVDWTDEQIVAAADTILRILTICTAAARRNGDRDWLEEFSWFVEHCLNELGAMTGDDQAEAMQPKSKRALNLN